MNAIPPADGPATVRQTLTHPAMLVFLALSLVHLGLVTADAGLLDSLTKAVLMPALAVWVVAVGGPRLLVAALIFSWVGDVALEIDGLFLLGMAGFGVAHVCFITWFLRHSALTRLRRQWWVPLAGYALWAGVLAMLWGPLGDEEPSLRLPILVYSLLLTTTAVTAFGVSRLAGVGGILFLLSDTLIAMGLADLPRPEPTGLWIMGTYLVAQVLLAVGMVLSEQHLTVRNSAVFSDAPEAR